MNKNVKFTIISGYVSHIGNLHAPCLYHGALVLAASKYKVPEHSIQWMLYYDTGPTNRQLNSKQRSAEKVHVGVRIKKMNRLRVHENQSFIKTVRNGGVSIKSPQFDEMPLININWIRNVVNTEYFLMIRYIFKSNRTEIRNRNCRQILQWIRRLHQSSMNINITHKTQIGAASYSDYSMLFDPSTEYWCRNY